MKNTVVGSPGTTMPTDPMATATQPPANQRPRESLLRRPLS